MELQRTDFLEPPNSLKSHYLFSFWLPFPSHLVPSFFLAEFPDETFKTRRHPLFTTFGLHHIYRARSLTKLEQADVTNAGWVDSPVLFSRHLVSEGTEKMETIPSKLEQMPVDTQRGRELHVLRESMSKVIAQGRDRCVRTRKKAHRKLNWSN